MNFKLTAINRRKILKNHLNQCLKFLEIIIENVKKWNFLHTKYNGFLTCRE